MWPFSAPVSREVKFIIEVLTKFPDDLETGPGCFYLRRTKGHTTPIVVHDDGSINHSDLGWLRLNFYERRLLKRAYRGAMTHLYEISVNSTRARYLRELTEWTISKGHMKDTKPDE